MSKTKAGKIPVVCWKAIVVLKKCWAQAAEGLVRIPAGDNAAEINTVFTKLGKPEKPDGYNIPAPQGGTVDKDFASWAKNAFHNSNLTTKQAENLATQWNDFQGRTVKAQQEAQQAKVAEEVKGLQREWGRRTSKHERRQERCEDVRGKIRNPRHLAGPDGYAGVMKFFPHHRYGTWRRPICGRRAGRQGIVYQHANQANSKLQGLMKDKGWSAKFMNGDATCRQEFDA